jgi:hypothetical protein
MSRQKKPAHEERVNPSFGRVEETGRTIPAAWRRRKFLFPILNITAVNNSGIVRQQGGATCCGDTG